jgi:2-oxoglutarate dehydrogenase E2 component (dihydrolipoamide succinyltransferase)
VYEITVPKLNSNDAGYVLTAWHYADGDTVPAGAEVAVVETSKAAEELTTAAGGVLHRRLAESQECRPGEVIGRLFPDERERQDYLAGDEAPPPATGLVITEPAQRLIDEHGISVAALEALGKTVIKSADVRGLLGAGPRIHRLGRAQTAVGEVVTESHRTIPAAYAVVEVTVDRIRLPESLIAGIAGQFAKFPLFFASALGDGTARLADAPRIGVTIDIGRGLTIPVLRGPDLASPAAIAAAMNGFREKALRDTFTAADLTGATIAVSLPAGDVLLAQPLVPPGLACMVALGATRTGPDGTAAAYLALSYDHRLINGRDAALFLGALKESLRALAEGPDA